jgi:hypothetical protein
MLTGYNTDFKFQGKIYHVQTEDGGVNSPFITSLLYSKGEILASRKTSYADIAKADCLDEVVREIMMEQHKQMIRDLMHGKLDLNNAPHESTYQSQGQKVAPVEEDAPVQKAVPVQKPTPIEVAAPVQKAAPIQDAPAPPPKPVPPPPQPPPSEDIKEKSLDDIILEFLAQEQKERKGS